MAKYMFLYRGPMPDMNAMTPEMGAAVMEQWNAWMGRIGNALQDGGTPLMPGGNVSGNSAGEKPADVNGYSIVEAKDLEAAKALLDGHPHLADPKNSVDVLELLPIPGT
jgi:hypothetical protein